VNHFLRYGFLFVFYRAEERAIHLDRRIFDSPSLSLRSIERNKRLAIIRNAAVERDH